MNTGNGKSQSGPSQFAVFTSAARTATPTPGYFENDGNARGVRIFVNTTAAGASPSTVFTIQVKDTKTGVFYDLLASAAVTGTGTLLLEVYPGFTNATNVRFNSHAGRGIRVTATHGNATSHTYSVTGEWLP